MKSTRIILLKAIVFIVIFCICTGVISVAGKATSLLNLNNDFDISGLSDNQAICQVALNQVGLTGRELGAVEGWCGDLIFSCALLCGIDGSIIPVTGSPREMYYGILNNGGKLIGWDYRAGDIAYYPFQGENGHIAIIAGEGIAVHGNIGSKDFLDSKVALQEFQADTEVIIIRPPYRNNEQSVVENTTDIEDPLSDANTLISESIDMHSGHESSNGELSTDSDSNIVYDQLPESFYIYEASDKDKHVPEINPSIENVLQPDCNNLGSYEKVFYCRDCGAELERKKVTVNRIYHHYAACNNGENSAYACSYCGISRK